MIFIAHQLGHVVEGFEAAPEFYTPGTHTRKGYGYRRMRRPMRLIVLGAMLWMR